MAKREKLFSVTAKDCDWDFFVGTGNGGQNKQKTNSACRCTHRASGAAGVAQDGRSQDLNKRKAFERMANTEVFQKWIKTEAMRRSGELAIIEAKVDEELTKAVVQVKNDKGQWEDAPADLQVTHWDIKNTK
jgi:protein subunit release factor B